MNLQITSSCIHIRSMEQDVSSTHGEGFLSGSGIRRCRGVSFGNLPSKTSNVSFYCPADFTPCTKTASRPGAMGEPTTHRWPPLPEEAAMIKQVDSVVSFNSVRMGAVMRTRDHGTGSVRVGDLGKQSIEQCSVALEGSKPTEKKIGPPRPMDRPDRCHSGHGPVLSRTGGGDATPPRSWGQGLSG